MYDPGCESWQGYKRLLSSPKYPHRLLGWPSFIFSGCRIFAPGYSGRVDHLPPPSCAVGMNGALPVPLWHGQRHLYAYPISKNALQPLTLYKVKHQMVPRKRGFCFPSRYVETRHYCFFFLASCPSVTRRSQCTCLVRRKQFRMAAVNGLAWPLSRIALSVYSLVQKYFRPPKGRGYL
jgi:hypothetical protein